MSCKNKIIHYTDVVEEMGKQYICTVFFCIIFNRRIMKRIVLVRHGESLWNKENRFTGWTNVDLSEKGQEEARTAGKLLKEAGMNFEVAYRSYL